MIYARVSSREQRKRSTIESQLRELPELAARLGLHVVGTYVDDGISGAALLERRQGLLGLLERLRAGDVMHVLVFDLDRFTRDVNLETRGRILGAIQASGAVIVELTTGTTYDLGTFEGRVMVQFRCDLAADWLEKHVQRVRSGQATARARGWLPAGCTPYGLDFDKASGFRVRPDEQLVIREIFKRLAAGESYKAIARALNERGVPSGNRRNAAARWSKSHIWRLAHAEYLVSEQWRHGGEPIAIPRILPSSLWQRAHEAMRGRRHSPSPRTHRVYLAQGRGVCSLCGAVMRVHSSHSRRKPYYICRNRLEPPRSGDRCSLPFFRVDHTDERIWAAVVSLLVEGWPEYREQLRQAAIDAVHGRSEVETTAHEAQAELDRLDGVESALLERFGDGAITPAAFDRQLARLHERRAVARERLAQAKDGLDGVGLDLDALDRAVDAARERLPDASPAIRQQLVGALVPGVGNYTWSFRPDGQLVAHVTVYPLASLSASTGKRKWIDEPAPVAWELAA